MIKIIQRKKQIYIPYVWPPFSFNITIQDSEYYQLKFNLNYKMSKKYLTRYKFYIDHFETQNSKTGRKLCLQKNIFKYFNW